MRRSLVFFGFVMLGQTVFAQAVSVGVLGGVPFTDPTGPNDESRRYLIGPSAEVRLPANFAIEFDALYQRIGSSNSFSVQQGLVTSSFVDRVRGNSWQFPLLGKYYFGSETAKWRPFVGTGYSLRIVDEHDASTNTTTDSSGSRISVAHFESANGLGIGATVVAGARYQKGHFAVLPQLRYTRWSDNANNLNRRNEAAVLLGITF